MIPLFIDALSNKLETPLPGWNAQKKMMIIMKGKTLDLKA